MWGPCAEWLPNFQVIRRLKEPFGARNLLLQQLAALKTIRLRDTAVTSNGIRDLETKLPRLTCKLR